MYLISHLILWLLLIFIRPFEKRSYYLFVMPRGISLYINLLTFLFLDKHGGESRDICTYIRTERIRIFVIISSILNECSYGKAQILHRGLVASNYLKDVSVNAVFFHSSSSKNFQSLLEVV